MGFRLNAYKSTEGLSETLTKKDWKINFSKKTRGLLQYLVNILAREGVAATIAPEVLQAEGIDIISFHNNSDNNLLKLIPKRYKPSIVSSKEIQTNNYFYLLDKAFQNSLREFLVLKDYIRVFNRYIPKNEFLNKTPWKNSFIVQTEIQKSHLIVLVKHRYKFMKNIGHNFMKRKVRVLPTWNQGLLTGPKGNVQEKMDLDETILDYWTWKYAYDFIPSDDLCVNIQFKKEDGTINNWSYPTTCVFEEWKTISLPHFLKKDVNSRVSLNKNFIHALNSGFTFLEVAKTFQGPFKVKDLGYSLHNVSASLHNPEQIVIKEIKDKQIVPFVTHISEVKNHFFRGKQPYSGKLDSPFIVVYPEENDDIVRRFFQYISKTYNMINFGAHFPLNVPELNNGYIATTSSADFKSTIIQLQEKISELEMNPLIYIVLPSDVSTQVYYETRELLFNPLFNDLPVLHPQSVKLSTIDKYFEEIRKGNKNRAYPILHNIVTQSYVKFGGTGTALWILKNPADISINKITPGSTCYAYFDISRRQEYGTKALAFSALTDPYGRFISSGTFPSGSEKLSPAVIYRMFEKILTKVSYFGKRYAAPNFNFQRLVFAKDGKFWDVEAKAIREIIFEGVPNMNKPPLAELLKTRSDLSNKLVIDIISVNKTPKRELYDFDQRSNNYSNPKRGYFITKGNTSLLVASSSTYTVQPLEITLHDHISINNDIPAPSIGQITDEYFRLTYLNWSSLYRLPKLALPQALTQAIGENITMGVDVAESYISI